MLDAETCATFKEASHAGDAFLNVFALTDDLRKKTKVFWNETRKARLNALSVLFR